MPCPRCFVVKEDIIKFGTRSDMQQRDNTRSYDRAREHAMNSARKYIYERGYAVGGDAIDGILGNKCIVPTRVSTSAHFFIFQADMSWRMHLQQRYRSSASIIIRCSWSTCFMSLNSECGRLRLAIYYAFYMLLVGICYRNLTRGEYIIYHILKLISLYRYRAIATFGCDTIRKFHSNASGMKSLAAHDFEDLLQVSCGIWTSKSDILQCALPVFECLLPAKQNDQVRKVQVVVQLRIPGMWENDRVSWG
jgi:hypothetical protein